MIAASLEYLRQDFYYGTIARLTESLAQLGGENLENVTYLSVCLEKVVHGSYVTEDFEMNMENLMILLSYSFADEKQKNSWL